MRPRVRVRAFAGPRTQLWPVRRVTTCVACLRSARRAHMLAARGWRCPRLPSPSPSSSCVRRSHPHLRPPTFARCRQTVLRCAREVPAVSLDGELRVFSLPATNWRSHQRGCHLQIHHGVQRRRARRQTACPRAERLAVR
ncbi:hypothetical protein K466DRAFT_415459 [Polyporus arcularius HHB13444]|uniref:Uncharacterized protein n=1 Tax=Polyporus arcularius HHB13444 TaxID=1314778 RepID=A0A5C3NR35_9APHY|nr:hypothetical protein K466DRAFT_415459 [Polyporus arcularius HHB13444]